MPLNPFIWEYAIEDGVPREPFARETARLLGRLVNAGHPEFRS